ncbi:MAG: hypothetical protein KIS92_20650 [Planctomycetota bacterium]|nr:hypothetical protein [Planctomycetota bacterium]
MMLNTIGAYGPWAARISGRAPGACSLRSGRFKNLDRWRRAARARVWHCLGAPDLPAVPKPRVDAVGEYDGLHVERLSWQLPWGPRTEAVFLKPLGAKGKLPGLLALHDHGGKKFFGWRKIAQVDGEVHTIIRAHRDDDYGGLAWANEAARRGYAVLCHDVFPFASRRVKIADTIRPVAAGQTDPGEAETNVEIGRYNAWAAEHEHIMAKALFSAGTTWPGVFVKEDQAALSILAARKDVDAKRLACGGLSGGGMRTVFLAGLDDRVRTCFCAGFFTTWVDLILYKNWTHTWMTYVPLLPRDLDFTEILGLRAPLPTLVLQCTEDPLFTTREVKLGGRMLKDVYRRAKAPEAFKLSLYRGGHKLDEPMQAEAFAWFERWLERA